jgi:3-phosphoinositide dependent protein kinase-1
LLHFSPFIIKLFYTYQDAAKLYFVLECADKGELLHWVKKVGSFDEECTRFYSAEILMALDHMHSKGIIHRDLKPENVLLDSNMHVKICDFGSAKDLSKSDSGRADSFVGTAQYVSPELLSDKTACKASDLWALGCIIYQLLSGDFPFRAGNEYQTFKKISALDYEIPEGFPDVPKSLVQSLLVLEPDDRLGAKGMEALKAHPFYTLISQGRSIGGWDNLHAATPPVIDAYLPAASSEDKAMWRSTVVDMDIDDLLAQAYDQTPDGRNALKFGDTERQKMLDEQEKTSPWHGFCRPKELIIKTSLVDKRRGLFSKRRQLVLTDSPRLFYIDPVELRMMGEVQLSQPDLTVQFRSPKTFFIHTPDRTYYLDDLERSAVTWVDMIGQVQKKLKEDQARDGM